MVLRRRLPAFSRDDRLFTLGQLAEKTPTGGATLRGRIASAASIRLEKLPAKIVPPGTNFPTLADADGCYEFRNLPAGTHDVVVLRPGSAITSAKVPLSPNQTATIDFTLTADSAVGNMIRNGALASLWLGPLQPDAWYRVRSRAVAANWEGELLPLKEGTTCRLSVAWQENAAGQVIVRLRKTADFNQLTIELKPLQPGETELSFPATGDTGFA